MQRNNKFRLNENKFKHASFKEFHRKQAKSAKRNHALERILFSKASEHIIEPRNNESKNDKMLCLEKNSIVGSYYPQRHVDLYTSSLHLSRAGAMGLFLFLLLDLVTANDAILSGSTQTLFSHSNNADQLVNHMQTKHTNELSSTNTPHTTEFLDSIKSGFRQHVRVGNLHVMKYHLEEKYPQYKKMLITSVTESDLAILKKGDEIPTWEDSGVGPCQKDDENHFYVTTYEYRDLCQRASRVPPKGAYMDIMNFLYESQKTLLAEQEGFKLPQLKP